MQNILQKSRQLYLGLVNRALPEYERHLLSTLLQSQSKMIGIYGARGVGKTTLMLQWLKHQKHPLSQTLYLSCDHPILAGVSLFDLAEVFVQHGGKILILDEVHDAPDFEQALKSIYDFLDVKVVFSGSSAVSLSHPDLSRRYAMLALPQLSVREFIEIKTQMQIPKFSLAEVLENPMDACFEVTQILAQADLKILPLFQDYLKQGGYPFYFDDPASFPQRLSDMINLVIQIELVQLFSIKSDKIDLLKKLLVVICRSKPLELSIEKLASNVGLSKPTLYKFLDYLQKGELLRQVPHELKKYQNIRRPDKLYLYHPNLLQVLCLNPDLGTLRETFFAAQLAAAGHQVEFAQQGDFCIDDQIIFEVGGKSKDFHQLKGVEKPAFIAADDIEIGSEQKIPLWLFGFLY